MLKNGQLKYYNLKKYHKRDVNFVLKEFKNVKVGYIPDCEVEINNKKYLIHGVIDGENIIVGSIGKSVVVGFGKTLSREPIIALRSATDGR